METDEKSNADYWNAKGLTHGKDRRFEDAIVCFDRANQLDPGHAKAWYNKALCLKNLGLYSEALACFSKAVFLTPAANYRALIAPLLVGALCSIRGAYDLWQGHAQTFLINVLPMVLMVYGPFFTFALWSMLADSRKARQKERADEEYATRHCSHGVAGALRNNALCNACAEEERRLIRDRERRQREAELAEQLRKQREVAEWKAKVRMPEFLQGMNPYEFEGAVCNLFRQMGYETELTRIIHEADFDLDFRGIVQAI